MNHSSPSAILLNIGHAMDHWILVVFAYSWGVIAGVWGVEWTELTPFNYGALFMFGAGSIVSLLLALSDDTALRGMVFWLLGDLTRGDRWGWLLTLLAAATLLCIALGRPLNVLARGETIAASVGLDVRRVRSIVFVLSSLLTGCAVSTAGSIGFVGLVTPHLVRLALGNDQRIVLAGSALLGGLVLMTADLASRLLLAPRQLPGGALTALVGVPIVLLLMLRPRN